MGTADTVTYSIVSGGLSGMALDSESGEFSWTPTEAQDGQHVVVFRAADNHGAASADQTVTITVNEVNDAPWRNETLPFDTNGDGQVVPLDALRIINQLNQPTILGAGGKLPDARPADPTVPYYDVNGDGFCTSNDVLRVINYLNDQEAEGEYFLSSDPVGDSVVFEIPRSSTSPANAARQRTSDEYRRAEPLAGKHRQDTRAPRPAQDRYRHPVVPPTGDQEPNTDSVLDAIATDVARAMNNASPDFWSSLD